MAFSATGGGGGSPAPSSNTTTPTYTPTTPTHTAPLTGDEYVCVVTGVRDSEALEVAHVISFSVRKEKTAVFRRFLGIFLRAEGPEALRGATLQLTRAGSAGEAANYMVLDVRVHKYFDERTVVAVLVV
ncbi:hypothetical protein P167DRAFT_540559 [Morchella conica CCBAS932]|uniref:HNH nuclease domain-containing protein n=1 Tax=Morchella conica CCBAS932 TaxID=1392247 RepID=A0A3N4KBY1_9PEZI|nr:hypothetical protein P167DRAFT_540559 [Morchella conica CCBAS932]